MTDTDANAVRAHREARGLTQSELATRVGLSRQSVNAIEVGMSTPSVDTAIRIGKALETSVEVLFGGTEPRLAVTGGSGASFRGGRLALVHVRGNWVAHALGDDGLRMSADAFADGHPLGHVRLARSEAAARQNVALAGCAPAIGIVADRLNARAGPGRFIWLAQSSGRALSSLASGRVHVAGVHLVDDATGEENVADVRRASCPFPVTVITLARWEVGLVIADGNPLNIRGVSDLARVGMRLVVREPESGAQRLLERCLRAVGLPARLPGAELLRAPGHLEVARLIDADAADAGIASRDASVAFGLGFVPLASERFDLVLESSFRDDKRLARLLDELATGTCRAELASLGYGVRESGAHVTDLAA